MAERKDREKSTSPIAWFDPFESPLNNERKFCLYFPEVYERISIELNHEYKLRLYVLNLVDL